MRITKIGVQIGLWLSLILALIGSLYHVAWSFSTLQGGDMRMGYVQAIAVDVGLAALTIGIQQRRRAGRPTGRLWAGVVLFAAISTYANLLHGFAHAEESMLASVPTWLKVMRPWLLSAALPLLVVYLSEIASEDDTARTNIERSVEAGDDETRTKAEVGALSKEDAKRLIVVLHSDQPTLSQRELSERIGRSLSTTNEYIAELRSVGAINGKH